MIPRLTQLLTLAFALALCACSGGGKVENGYRMASGNTWGTTYHITYKSSRDLHDSIVEQMRLVDMSLSVFEPNSLVSRVNRGEDVHADVLLWEVMELSSHINKVSSGAFDPTVAPLINLWGFGNRQAPREVPTGEAIDSCMELVGMAQCCVLPDGRIQKKHPRTEFNFSAIAKGYGVDLIASMLQRNGCHNYMVEVGGEIALSGKNPRGEDWHIQIDAPLEEADTVSHQGLTVLELTNCCIATSGNYRNYRDTSDGRIGHTISPVTGRPARTRTLSATVIAPSCALADALATAAMVLPDHSAAAMLRSQPGIEALLVVAEPDGSLHIEKVQSTSDE